MQSPMRHNVTFNKQLSFSAEVVSGAAKLYLGVVSAKLLTDAHGLRCYLYCLTCIIIPRGCWLKYCSSLMHQHWLVCCEFICYSRNYFWNSKQELWPFRTGIVLESVSQCAVHRLIFRNLQLCLWSSGQRTIHCCQVILNEYRMDLSIWASVSWSWPWLTLIMQLSRTTLQFSADYFWHLWGPANWRSYRICSSA